MQGIPVAYDTALPQNGVNMNVGTQLSVPYTRFGAQPVGSYMPGSQWVSGYMMAQPMAQVDDQVNKFPIRNSLAQYTNDIYFCSCNLVYANGATSKRESSIQTRFCITGTTSWCFDDNE